MVLFLQFTVLKKHFPDFSDFLSKFPDISSDKWNPRLFPDLADILQKDRFFLALPNLIKS